MTKQTSRKKYPIQQFLLNVIYVDDLQAAIDFYTDYFDFKIEIEVGEMSAYGESGNVDLWIIGGFERSQSDFGRTRASIMYEVEDIMGLFKAFKDNGVQLLQQSPVKMPNEMYWFQVLDPAGNILEIVGDLFSIDNDDE